MIILILGIFTGWLMRGLFAEPEIKPGLIEAPTISAPTRQDVPVLEPDEDPAEFLAHIANDSVSRRIARMREFLQDSGDEFEILVSIGDELMKQRQYEQSLEMLLRASFVVKSIRQQDSFEFILARLVDRYSKELISMNQFSDVDQLYEMLTLSLPQLAQYQLDLGRLRIRMGNDQLALPPLAQIANHDQLGAEARQLMAQIERNEAATPASVEELPLIANGGQFLVEASIDDSLNLLVLIDTGAAMTVLESSELERLGYNLSSRLEYFSTANGVVQAPVVILESLSLGDARLSNVSVGALNLNMPRGVKGLLGMNFLRHYDFRIDQDKNLLILNPR